MAGTGAADEAEPGATVAIRGPVPPGATVTWSAVLAVNEVHMSVFGVYPLAAQADSGGAVTLGTSRTFLPFWPAASPADQPRESIAWIWPLIDQPDQGPCPGLLNNNLAGQPEPAAAGWQPAEPRAPAPAGQAAKLTWVIDPALLASAQAMAGPGPYVTGSRATGSAAACSPGTTHPASAQAAAWLAKLRAAVASQPAVVTPYADVDIAALVQQDLDGDVHTAFSDGRAIAGRDPEQQLRAVGGRLAGRSAAELTGGAWPGPPTGRPTTRCWRRWPRWTASRPWC